MEGVSVTNAVTLAADATLQIDCDDGRAATETPIVGAIATPGSGAATLKVVGDLSGLSENVSIPLGARADGASEAAITVDATELMLPSARWRTRLKARDGVFALDVKKSVGMTIYVR